MAGKASERFVWAAGSGEVRKGGSVPAGRCETSRSRGVSARSGALCCQTTKSSRPPRRPGKFGRFRMPGPSPGRAFALCHPGGHMRPLCDTARSRPPSLPRPDPAGGDPAGGEVTPRAEPRGPRRPNGMRGLAPPSRPVHPGVVPLGAAWRVATRTVRGASSSPSRPASQAAGSAWSTSVSTIASATTLA